jgi:hypothetical protein
MAQTVRMISINPPSSIQTQLDNITLNSSRRFKISTKTAPFELTRRSNYLANCSAASQRKQRAVPATLA